MIVVSHPTVNSFVRTLVESLHREGLLSAFHTTLTWGRRSVDIPFPLIHAHPLREMVRLLGGRLGIGALSRHETGWASVDSVYRELDGIVSCRLDRATSVYCYEDGARDTFEAALERGIGRIYELPIAYWESVQRLLREEAKRLPEWEPTLSATRDSESKLQRKSRELALADLVVCPSRFVQNSLPPGTRSIVAEFGSPPILPIIDRNGNGPLRVLFAGSMSQRKGLADLFEAMKILGSPQAELIVMGSPVVPISFYSIQYPAFRHEKPRPHAQFLELMQTCDLLVLPSIVEGRALVQQEALSCGLPLIVTANAGGEDLVIEGETGFLVPIRSPQAIAEKLSWFLDNRPLLPEMRRAAQRMAARCSWANYAQKIISSLG
jgi:glycosyltransferase involved in cell wall biosynthesis